MRIKSRGCLAVCLASLAFAAGVLWVALEHNPQGEFYGSELGIDWPAILFLFFIYFLLAFLSLFSLAWLVGRVLSKRPGATAEGHGGRC